MRIGSLFSGIGGLELGLERAGVGHVVWQVELDPFCRSILAKHWPEAQRFEDVCKVGANSLSPVDVLCGGFPCQDLSVAGRGAGLGGERSGLWYEFRRLVGELQPAFVVAENVAHGRGRWLPFVRHDLEALGYGTRAFVLGADEVGAPHQRRRCFVIAHADGLTVRQRAERVPARRARGVRGKGQGKPLDARASGRPAGSSAWGAFPSVLGVDDGVPSRLDRERALGNAVVPQVAEVIGRVLLSNREGSDG